MSINCAAKTISSTAAAPYVRRSNPLMKSDVRVASTCGVDGCSAKLSHDGKWMKHLFRSTVTKDTVNAFPILMINTSEIGVVECQYQFFLCCCMADVLQVVPEPTSTYGVRNEYRTTWHKPQYDTHDSFRNRIFFKLCYVSYNNINKLFTIITQPYFYTWSIFFVALFWMRPPILSSSPNGNNQVHGGMWITIMYI